MSWLPPWLGTAYSSLYAVHGSRSFDTGSASRALGSTGRRTNLILSLLTRRGWLVRVGRGRYALPGPGALVALEAAGLSELHRRASFYPVLALGLSGLFRTFSENLRAVALFGSCARNEYKAESDVDLLAVLERYPGTAEQRQVDLARVEAAPRELNRFLWATRHEYHLLQVALLDRRGLAGEPSLLLDLVDDARVLWDPEGTLAEALEGIRRRLRARGSRRVHLEGGRTYWDLTPTGYSGPLEAL